VMRPGDDLEARLRRDAEAVRRAAQQDLTIHQRIMGRLAGISPGRRAQWGSRAAQLLLVVAFTLAAAGAFLLFHRSATPAESPPITPSSAVPIETAQFLNSQDGLVVTQRGLLMTRDGGQTWQLILKLDWHNNHDIRFIDSNHIIVVSNSTTQPPAQPIPLVLYATADGGGHWQTSSVAPITSGTSRGAFFINDHEGWQLVSSGEDPANPTMAALYHTVDGGAHWVQLNKVDATHPSSGGMQLSSAPEDLFFTDAMHGFMGTASGDNIARLFVTQDGGATWKAAIVPPPPGGSGYGFTLASNMTIVGATGFLTESSASGVVVYSTLDGGQTWGSPRLLPFAKGRAYEVDRTHWWAAGEGMLYETADAGASWQRLPDFPIDIWPYLEALNATGPEVFWGQLIQSSIPGDSPIAGVPPSTCFQSAYGPDCSFLVRSTDGGHNWTDVKLPRS
jgi:photosystem II stability/assembly factor-like uncharacterized protein